MYQKDKIMDDFEQLYNNLYDSVKHEYNIISFRGSKSGFNITIPIEDMSKLTKADIIVFNHKSKQYRIFKFDAMTTDSEMFFKCDNIILTIHGQ